MTWNLPVLTDLGCKTIGARPSRHRPIIFRLVNAHLVAIFRARSMTFGAPAPQLTLRRWSGATHAETGLRTRGVSRHVGIAHQPAHPDRQRRHEEMSPPVGQNIDLGTLETRSQAPSARHRSQILGMLIPLLANSASTPDTAHRRPVAGGGVAGAVLTAMVGALETGQPEHRLPQARTPWPRPRGRPGHRSCPPRSGKLRRGASAIGSETHLSQTDPPWPPPRKKSPSSPAPRAASGWRPRNGFSPRAGDVALLDIERNCCARGRGAGRSRSYAGAALRRLDAEGGGQRDRRRSNGASAGSMRWSTMPASRCSRRCSTPPMKTGARAGGQPHRAVPVHQGGGAPDARTWRRRDRQHHRLISRGARLHAALGLRHQQSGARASDQAARGRTGLARHSRQWRRPGPVETAMAKAGPYPGNPRRLSRRHSAQPLRPRRGTGGSDASCAAIARATSPGRSSPSMAASMPPASACRRCAASGGTGNAASYPLPRRGKAGKIAGALRWRSVTFPS